MNRRICLLAMAILALGCARAEIDIDSLSLDSLYALRDQVNARISKLEQTSDQQIYDSGTYSVGSDIPAGDYVVIENQDAMFASVIVREDADEDSDLVSHHLINGQAAIRLNPGTWVTFSEARAYPLSQAPRIESDTCGEGGYLVGETLPAGTYQLYLVDKAPLSSYSVYDGILGTDAQLTKFEVLHDATTIALSDGDYIELSGCGLTATTSTEGTEP